MTTLLLKTKRGTLLSSLATQNMTLKVCLLAAAVVIVVETISLISLAFKKPLIVSLENDKPQILITRTDTDSISLPEIRAFVIDLLSRKFSKTPTLESQKSVCKFFSEGLKAACEKEISEKKLLIPQDFITQDMSWDERSQISRLGITRYATFNGIVSAIQTKLTIKIQRRQRSLDNPWGLFVTEWKEEVQK